MKIEDIRIIGMTFVNAFLIRVTDGFILIDTGLEMHWDRLNKELETAGCFPGNLKLVIITHGDFDHAGNCVKLREKYHCKIAMHENDLSMVEKGVHPIRVVKSLSARIFMKIRRLMRKKFTFEYFTPDLYLTDGQKLTEYGLDASIIHLPGHTKGSIGVLSDDGILFAGDIFTNRGKPDTATYIEDASELENSLARLNNMKIIMVYPGHGSPFPMDKIRHKL
ncbi:MAG: MBL fold metallo-hydrolase [Bacteroidales bacterium]|jgi:glyoxylase-like metal-dependent hydrolase (beta-lactamase superfamily II)